jgi:hypothetical protein
VGESQRRGFLGGERIGKKGSMGEFYNINI